MKPIPHQYITDHTGKKISVILPIDEYHKFLEALDELEDIRLYDESKSVNEPSVPVDEAFKLMEENRKKKS
ncbi:MAG: hypothetical protein N2747_08925 [Chitinophagaceae bacterium]|nr:hypothetical protein [Chitinophagaceae bacterium]